MGSAKQIVLKVIPKPVANKFVRRVHYSGKTVANSQLSFGCFLDDELHGVMQFGPPMDKNKALTLVRNTGWNDFLELNRMAFDDTLPRNSESRCISIAMKLIRKNAPHVRWVLSYSDATQCGDGIIYRASGFKLIGIKRNTQIMDWNGRIIAKKSLDNANFPKIDGKYYSGHLLRTGAAKLLDGFQIRYIYFLDKTAVDDLTVPVLPFSALDDAGAKMYKGKKL